MGLMTAYPTVTYSTGLKTGGGGGAGGAHQNTHDTVVNKRRIRNFVRDNKLTVNTGRSADKTRRNHAAQASLCIH